MPVEALDNDTMVRMMAEENLSEWEHNFGIEAGTIRSVLEAAEAGEISLPPKGKRGPAGKLSADGQFLSTDQIAEFLGGNWSRQRVHRCLQVLDQLGDEASKTFAGTKPTLAEEITKTAVELTKGQGQKALQRTAGPAARR
jgi:hypothetical protein